MRVGRSVLLGLVIILVVLAYQPPGESEGPKPEFSGEVDGGNYGNDASPEIKLDEGDRIRMVLGDHVRWTIKDGNNTVIASGKTSSVEDEISNSSRFTQMTAEGDIIFTANRSATYTVSIRADLYTRSEYAIYVNESG